MYVSVTSTPVKLKGILSLKGVSPTVVTLGWVSLITDVSSEMVTAVIPLFVLLQLGLPPAAYGAIEGIHQVGSVVARLAGGYLGDLRRPKWVAATGYAASAACKLMFVFATSFAALFAVISLDRCGKGLRTAPRDAMITAASEPDVLGRAFGVHRTMDTLGALLGPLLAWCLLLLAADDFVLVFLVSFCIALIAVLLIIFLQPESAAAHGGPAHAALASEASGQPGKPEARSEVDRSQLYAVLTDRRYLRLNLVCAALALSTISDGFLYLLLLKAETASATQFPLFFVGTSLAYLIFALPLGNIADQIGRPRVFLMGYLALLVAYLASGLLSGPLAIGLCLGFLGLHYAATDGMLPAAAAPLLPAHLRATGLSILQSVTATGKAISAVLFGIGWSFFGVSGTLWVFTAALACAVVAASVLLRIARQEVAR